MLAAANLRYPLRVIFRDADLLTDPRKREAFLDVIDDVVRGLAVEC
jgi:hypothetical protein